jgi:hypothetical protein
MQKKLDQWDIHMFHHAHYLLCYPMGIVDLEISIIISKECKNFKNIWIKRTKKLWRKMKHILEIFRLFYFLK